MEKKVNELKKNLKEGKVYRRAELTRWSNAIDRHLSELLKAGFIQKLSTGLYYVPKKNIFGSVPPDDKSLVRTFLKDDDFLLTSLNAYNSLGVGTTQLYNTRVVYNHKRHGEFELGGKKFFFHAKHKFPNKHTPESLLVDLVNNLEQLAEDKSTILNNVRIKATTMNKRILKQAVLNFGNAKAKALFADVVQGKNMLHNAN